MSIVYDKNIPRWLNYTKSFIETNDLDPVYVGVNSAIRSGVLTKEQAHNFLLVMSTFYSIGEACKVVTLGIEGKDIWAYLIDNYATLKRGTGRRHFRGEQGLRCLSYLKANYGTPSDFVEHHHRPTYKGICEGFDKVPNFGPYHVWKWLDFFDRILELPVQVDLDHALSVLPSEPAAGAELVSKEMFGEILSTDVIVKYMLEECHRLNLRAPPNHDRLINVQEIETALCGIKHCYHGTDFLGKDVTDKYESIKSLGKDGAWLLPHMPKPSFHPDFLDPTFCGNILEFD